MCVCACVRACLRACVRACVCVCLRDWETETAKKPERCRVCKMHRQRLELDRPIHQLSKNSSVIHVQARENEHDDFAGNVTDHDNGNTTTARRLRKTSRMTDMNKTDPEENTSKSLP